LVLLGLGLWTLFYLRVSSGLLQNNDALDYAQVGRQLYQGKGFTSLHIFAYELPLLKEKGFLNKEFPILHRFPLPCVLDALSFFLFGPSEFAVAFASGIFYLLSIPVIFLLAKRVFGQSVGLASTLIFILSREMLSQSITGMTEAAAVFFFLSLLLLLSDSAGHSSNRYFWAGIVLGLACLNRSNTFFFLPVLGVAIYLRNHRYRIRSSATFLVAALLVMAPWFLRNALVAGDPLLPVASRRFFLSGYGVRIFQDMDAPDLLGALQDQPGRTLEKWVRNVSLLLHLPDLPFEYLFIPVLLLSYLFPLGTGARRTRNLGVVLFLVQVAVLSLGYVVPRYYVIYALLGMVYAVGTISALLGRFFPQPRALFPVLSGALIIILAFPLARNLTTGSRKGRDQVAEDMHVTQALLARGSLVASIQSPQVAWYGGFRSLKLPDSPEELLQINRQYRPVDAIYLSPRIGRRKDLERCYYRWLSSTTLQTEYRIARRFESGAVLLQRRPQHQGPGPPTPGSTSTSPIRSK
jgi:4-amino-4-deoxy-L-arabinose transferase-like glycosyltransferase